MSRSYIKDGYTIALSLFLAVFWVVITYFALHQYALHTWKEDQQAKNFPHRAWERTPYPERQPQM